MSKAWKIALIGTLIHLFLGTIYAWSFFQKPIMDYTQWNNVQTTMAFSLAILSLGFTASWAGRKLQQYKPQRLTIIGGLLFGLGYVIASWALPQKNITLFYAGFGIISGCGLGLAYVTPVAVVSQWFTQKQGLATGLVVMGFGLGAFFMSKILAPFLFEWTNDDIALSFRYFGIIFMLIIPVLGFFLQFPSNKNEISEVKKTISIINNQKKWIIWGIFTLNIISGMIFLSFQSPLLQDLLLKSNPNEKIENLAKIGATLIAVSAFCNGIGRLLWAALSDKIGRIKAFRILIGVEIVSFCILTFTSNYLIFSILVCLVLLCYGGAFGILPALVRDEFGKNNMPKIYGQMLTGWGIGGLIGTLLTALLKDTFDKQAGMYVFIIGVCILSTALILSLTIRKSNS